MQSVKRKYNYTFADGDDIAQEAYLIGLKAMEKYRPESGCILHFLYKSVGNRIKNYIRDKSKREIDTCSLDNIQDEYETIGNMHTTSNDFWDIVDDKLPVSLRKDYLKLRHGMQISKARKAKIIEEIRKIVNESL